MPTVFSVRAPHRTVSIDAGASVYSTVSCRLGHAPRRHRCSRGHLSNGASERIIRAVPQGPITTPVEGIAVIATPIWHSGQDTEEPAVATAWTREAVEVAWTTPWGDQRRDWIPPPLT